MEDSSWGFYRSPCTHEFNHSLQEDAGHLRAALCLLQPGAGSDCPPEDKPHPQTGPPAWCKCARCVPTMVPHEQLCCRRSDGACITSSPLFELLVLRRSTLDAARLYHDPLSSPAGPGQTTSLRHSAYRQYICWRIGDQADGSHPAIPGCCVRRIREEYPSLDGQYSGFSPERTATIQVISNGELWLTGRGVPPLCTKPKSNLINNNRSKRRVKKSTPAFFTFSEICSLLSCKNIQAFFPDYTPVKSYALPLLGRNSTLLTCLQRGVPLPVNSSHPSCYTKAAFKEVWSSKPPHRPVCEDYTNVFLCLNNTQICGCGLAFFSQNNFQCWAALGNTGDLNLLTPDVPNMWWNFVWINQISRLKCR